MEKQFFSEASVMCFQHIRDMREDSDLSQQKIVEYPGIAQTVYSRYERGYQTIPLEHLIKWRIFTE